MNVGVIQNELLITSNEYPFQQVLIFATLGIPLSLATYPSSSQEVKYISNNVNSSNTLLLLNFFFLLNSGLSFKIVLSHMHVYPNHVSLVLLAKETK